MRCLVHHFVQNEILFSQVGHTILRLLPLVLPELNCQRLVFCVQESLSVAHLEDLVDRLLFDLLLFGRFTLRRADLLVGDQIGLVERLGLLHVRFL